MRLDRSPILLPRELRDGPRAVKIVADMDTGIVEVTVSGRWDRRLHQAGAGVLRSCLAAHPAAVIVDLQDLGDPSGAGAGLWVTARQRGAQRQPVVPVVASLPTQAPLARALRRRGVDRVLPLYATVPEARAALISARPRTDRLWLRLEPDLTRIAEARNLVTDACARWQLPDLLFHARNVMSELVTNAIEHAATPVEATVTRLPVGLHLAVRDGDPELPELRRGGAEPGDIDARGFGLWAVHHAATCWGVLPARSGKAVWAILTGYPGGNDAPPSPRAT